MGFKYTLIVVVALAGLVAGCASFVGDKLGADGALPAPEDEQRKHGIPFMLPRPVFNLAITPDATEASKANFQLTLEYVPDPKQTYSLRLAPTVLTETSFMFNYSESLPGVLSSIGGGMKEQVTPTIKAIGDFTASVIGLGTTSTSAQALLTPAQAPPALAQASGKPVLAQFSGHQSAKETPEPDQESDKPILADLVDKIQNHCSATSARDQAVGKQIADDIKHFIPASLDPSDPDVALWHAAERSMRTLYYYKTPEQRDCLMKIARIYIVEEIKDVERKTAALLCAWTDAIEEGALECPPGEQFVDGNNPGSADDNCPVLRGEIKEALRERDILALIGLLQQVKRAIAKADKENEQEKICPDRQTSLRDAIEIAKRPADGRTRTVKFLEFFALMPDDIWRARQILLLRRMRGLCIAESFQPSWSRCKEQFRPDNVNHITAKLDRKIALTAGEQSRYERMLKLSEFLLSVPDRDVQGGKAPAAAEYAAIRDEFDALNTSYHAAVDAVVAQNRDAPQPTAPPSPPGSQDPPASVGEQNVSARDLFDVPIKDQDFVKKSQERKWDPDGKPDFVIVVEPYGVEHQLDSTKETNQ